MLSSRKQVSALIILVLAISLSACGQPAERTSDTTDEVTQTEIPTTTTKEKENLVGTEWMLNSLRDENPLPHTAITLEIDRKELGGSAGCNLYGGEYSSRNGELKMRGTAMTAMGCAPDEVSRQENAYVDSLSKVVTYRVKGDQLELQSSSGQTILAYSRRPQWKPDPADLVDTRWKLDSLNGTAPNEASTPTLSFGRQGLYSGYDGCRNFDGLYAPTENALHFSPVNMKALDCLKPIPTDGSDSYIGAFPPAGDYRLVDNKLEIRTPNSDSYVLVPLNQENDAVEATTPWKLVRFVENGTATPVLEGTEITIAFDRGTLRENGTVRGAAGCNQYSANYVYRTYPGGLEGPNFHDFAVTRKLCRGPDSIMEQERRYLNFLEEVRGYYQRVDGRLYLVTRAGDKMVFAGSG
ncbi:hypothetical protein BH23ACT11_BH23ACT11_20360 [soil metagenome]